MKSVTGNIICEYPTASNPNFQRICICNINFETNPYIKSDYNITFEDRLDNKYEIHVEHDTYCRMCKFFKVNATDINFTMGGWKEVWGFLIKIENMVSISYGSMK